MLAKSLSTRIFWPFEGINSDSGLFAAFQSVLMFCNDSL